MQMNNSESTMKKYSKSEKIAIVKEALEKGIPVTLAKYNVYRTTFDYWKKNYIVHGESGFDRKRNRDLEQENKKLAKENEQLKLLVAEKELEGKLKDEQLKKKYPELRKFL